MSTSCVKRGHFHCKYCRLVFLMRERDYTRFAEHMRDKHPEIWADDSDLRAEGESRGVR